VVFSFVSRIIFVTHRILPNGLYCSRTIEDLLKVFVRSLDKNRTSSCCGSLIEVQNALIRCKFRIAIVALVDVKPSAFRKPRFTSAWKPWISIGSPAIKRSNELIGTPHTFKCPSHARYQPTVPHELALPHPKFGANSIFWETDLVPISVSEALWIIFTDFSRRIFNPIPKESLSFLQLSRLSCKVRYPRVRCKNFHFCAFEDDGYYRSRALKNYSPVLLQCCQCFLRELLFVD